MVTNLAKNKVPDPYDFFGKFYHLMKKYQFYIDFGENRKKR